MFSRANGEYGMGRLHAAQATTLTALEICDRIGETRLATWLYALSAIVLADMSEDAAAQVHAARGLELAQELNQIVLDCWTMHGHAHVLAQRDDWTQAAQVNARCVARAAPRVVDKAGSLHGQGLAHRVQGQLFAHETAWANAENEFARALALFEKIGGRLEIARTLVRRGAMFWQQGKLDWARADWERARAEFSEMGAEAEWQRAEKLLA
jgi:tetratricopeptide (TPR) repeat protein